MRLAMKLLVDQDERDLAATLGAVLAAECPTLLARALHDPAARRLPSALWKALADTGVLGLGRILALGPGIVRSRRAVATIFGRLFGTARLGLGIRLAGGLRLGLRRSTLLWFQHLVAIGIGSALGALTGSFT